VGTEEEYLSKPQSFYMGDSESMQKDFFFIFVVMTVLLIMSVGTPMNAHCYHEPFLTMCGKMMLMYYTYIPVLF
jgi:hypothetical protein